VGLVSAARRELDFGQHLLNGFSVGFGVGAVATLFSLFFSFTEGMAAGVGAICISVGDIPNPLASKLKILPLSLILATVSALLIAISFPHPALQGLIVVAVSFVAGMLVGYGRWALPVSVLTMLALVFTLGAPQHDLADALNRVLFFSGGGFCYMLASFALTQITETGSRRIAVAETLREFALYLREMANFYDRAVPLPEVYRRVVEQQAALADHLQAARQQVFLGRQSESARKLAAIIVVQLDAMDTVISAHADYQPLRSGACGIELPVKVAALVRGLADDLDQLSRHLLRINPELRLPDRSADLAAISQEVQRLLEANRAQPRSLRAARATRTKFAWVAEHLGRLPKVMQTPGAADQVLAGIDLSAFLQPLPLSPKLLRRHLHLSSPVMRHAIRLAAAMATGYALIWLVPALSHGNWILLTIAVILRAQYAVTRQRRNDRLIGNLIGCLIAALLLKLTAPGLQLALIPIFIAIGHAYVRVNYLLTSSAAAVMALLSLHFLDPVAAAPILDRLLDTVIGAVIAFAFSRLLPRWEYQEAPRLVRSLMKSFTAYMGDALKRDISEQSYRLARKTMLESLAAITESASRVANEPQHAREAMPADLGDLLSAAYALAAQIVGIRVLLRHRKAEINPGYADDLLQQSRAIVLGQLDLRQEADEWVPDDHDEAHVDAEKALKLRCKELCRDAARLHEVAARFQGAAK
jgi:uncharacterized membrane protein YccC